MSLVSKRFCFDVFIYAGLYDILKILQLLLPAEGRVWLRLHPEFTAKFISNIFLLA